MCLHQKLGNDVAIREVYSVSNIPHTHNEIEIVYLKDGEAKLTIDGVDYKLSSNSIAVVFPNQVHKYTDDLNEVNGCMIYIPIEKLEGMYKSIVNTLPTIPIINQIDDELIQIIDMAEQEVTYNTCNDIISNLLPKLQCKIKSDTNLSTIQILLNYCFNNYKEPLNLDQLSKELSINKFYISHIFNCKLEVSFTDYLAILRVAEAKKQLTQTNKSITNIAYDVGFSTIRSFNRRFREYCNISPKEFRELHNN